MTVKSLFSSCGSERNIGTPNKQHSSSKILIEEALCLSKYEASLKDNRPQLIDWLTKVNKALDF